MSLSKYNSTPETTNTARLARLILGPCTDVLRDILRNELSPSDLSKEVKKWTDDFFKKKRRSPLTASQSDIIFPSPTNNYAGDFSDLDISLLYTILRNVSKISPPATGWGESPDPVDRSIAANIERIRSLRNKYYGHSADISLSDSEFRQEWRNIRDIVVELERHLGSSTDYQDSVIEIKTCSMDPELEQKYINRLGTVDELHSNVSNVSETLKGVKMTLDMCTESLQSIKEKPDPSVEKEIETTTAMVTKHQDEITNIFVKTRAFERAKELLEKNRHVIIKGIPGAGKTTVAKCLLKIFMDRGKRPLQVLKISEIYGRVSPADNLVIFIDNAFGEYKSSMNDFMEFLSMEDLIKSLLKPNTSETGNILIMTIRNDIYLEFFCEQKQQNHVSLIHSSVTDLSRGKYSLNAEEIIMFFNNYNLPENFKENLKLRQTETYLPLGCPQCCRLARDNPKFRNDVSSFLSSSFLFLKSYMENLMVRKTEKTAVLIYILLKGGWLEASLLSVQRDRDMKTIALKMLEINPLSIGKFHEWAKYFEGYLTTYDKINRGYEFSQTSVHEVLFNILVVAFPGDIIQNCHHFLLQRLTTNKKLKDTHTLVDKEVFKNVASRIKEILKDGLSEGYKSISLMQLWTEKGFNEYILADQVCCSLFQERTDSKGNALMVYFAKSGHIGMLKHLYQSMSDNQKYRSLNAACKENNENIVDYILAAGVNCDLKTCFYAVQSGNLDLLLKICKFVDITQLSLSLVCDDSNVKHSLIQEVCLSRQFHLMLPLIEHYQTLVDIISIDGETILHYVSEQGEYDLCTHLVINYPHLIYIKNNEGFTLLHSACISGDTKLISFLLEKGMDINELTYKGESVLHIASENGKHEACEFLITNFPHLIDIKDDDGFTVLHNASGIGSPKLICFLISKGLDVETRTNSGKSVLHIACSKGNYDACVYFVTNYQHLIDIKNNAGYTALHYACEIGDLKMISFLLANGLNINEITRNGENVFHIACRYGKYDACEFFSINYPQLVDKKCYAGFTALHLASISGNKKLFSFLIANGFDATALTDSGESVLHIACRSGIFDVCNYIVINFPQLIDLKNNEGYMALHSASISGDIRIIAFLTEKGMNINTLTNDGKSVLHLSCCNGKVDACEYIITSYPYLIHVIDKSGWTALHSASVSGSWKLISLMIEKGLDINAVNNTGENALHIACLYCTYDATKYLVVNYPHLLEVKQNSGYTALHCACISGDEKLISFLIESGADVNALTNDDKSVLHVACFNGQYDACEYLLTNFRRLIKAKDTRGYTILHDACVNGDTQLISLLIEEGLDINALTNIGESVLHVACSNVKYDACGFLVTNYPHLLGVKDKEGFTPLHRACTSIDIKMISFLIEIGIDINSLTNSGESVLHIACRYGIHSTSEYLVNNYPQLCEVKDSDGLTVLHSACISGQRKLISFLLEKGMDINALTNFGESVLHKACAYSMYVASEYLVINYPHLIKFKDFKGYTALHEACIEGDKKLISFLITNGVDINALTTAGKSVLHIACRFGKYDACEYFLTDYSHLIGIRENNGYTVLHNACAIGNPKLISFLISNGADIKALTNCGKNVLHIASSHGNYDACVFFVTNYPQLIDVKQDGGFTPLHSACLGGDEKLVSFLISKGSDINKKTDTGDTVLHLACLFGNYDVTEYLVNNFPQLIDLRDKKGNTPLRLACNDGDDKLISLLADKGSNINSLMTLEDGCVNVQTYYNGRKEYCEYYINKTSN